MINLKTNTGATLSYDKVNNVILINGKLNKNWKPVYLPSKNEVLNLFGFLNPSSNIVYDIYGGTTVVRKSEEINI
jgi:hypothetical protein